MLTWWQRRRRRKSTGPVDDGDLTLGPLDAAVVWRQGGRLEILLPAHDEDDDIPIGSPTWWATACAVWSGSMTEAEVEELNDRMVVIAELQKGENGRANSR